MSEIVLKHVLTIVGTAAAGAARKRGKDEAIFMKFAESCFSLICRMSRGAGSRSRHASSTMSWSTFRLPIFIFPMLTEDLELMLVLREV